MEQIKQLRDMRDAAQKRIEEALAAIQNSPDAKLVNSLTTLIKDLEEAVGESNSGSSTKTFGSFSDKDATEAVEGGKTEPLGMNYKLDSATSNSKADDKSKSSTDTKASSGNGADKSKSDNDKSSSSFSKKDEMSLEDSLEAELLNS